MLFHPFRSHPAEGRGWRGFNTVLADALGQEHSVEKSRIAESTESALSLMPAVFGESIPEADFYNLLAYLLEH